MDLTLRTPLGDLILPVTKETQLGDMLRQCVLKWKCLKGLLYGGEYALVVKATDVLENDTEMERHKIKPQLNAAILGENMENMENLVSVHFYFPVFLTVDKKKASPIMVPNLQQTVEYFLLNCDVDEIENVKYAGKEENGALKYIEIPNKDLGNKLLLDLVCEEMLKIDLRVQTSLLGKRKRGDEGDKNKLQRIYSCADREIESMANYHARKNPFTYADLDNFLNKFKFEEGVGDSFVDKASELLVNLWDEDSKRCNISTNVLDMKTRHFVGLDNLLISLKFCTNFIESDQKSKEDFRVQVFKGGYGIGKSTNMKKLLSLFLQKFTDGFGFYFSMNTDHGNPKTSETPSNILFFRICFHFMKKNSPYVIYQKFQQCLRDNTPLNSQQVDDLLFRIAISALGKRNGGKVHGNPPILIVLDEVNILVPLWRDSLKYRYEGVDVSAWKWWIYQCANLAVSKKLNICLAVGGLLLYPGMYDLNPTKVYVNEYPFKRITIHEATKMLTSTGDSHRDNFWNKKMVYHVVPYIEMIGYRIRSMHWMFQHGDLVNTVERIHRNNVFTNPKSKSNEEGVFTISDPSHWNKEEIMEGIKELYVRQQIDCEKDIITIDRLRTHDRQEALKILFSGGTISFDILESECALQRIMNTGCFMISKVDQLFLPSILFQIVVRKYGATDFQAAVPDDFTAKWPALERALDINLRCRAAVLSQLHGKSKLSDLLQLTWNTSSMVSILNHGPVPEIARQVHDEPLVKKNKDSLDLTVLGSVEDNTIALLVKNCALLDLFARIVLGKSAVNIWIQAKYYADDTKFSTLNKDISDFFQALKNTKELLREQQQELSARLVQAKAALNSSDSEYDMLQQEVTKLERKIRNRKKCERFFERKSEHIYLLVTIKKLSSTEEKALRALSDNLKDEEFSFHVAIIDQSSLRNQFGPNLSHSFTVWKDAEEELVSVLFERNWVLPKVISRELLKFLFCHCFFERKHKWDKMSNNELVYELLNCNDVPKATLKQLVIIQLSHHGIIKWRATRVNLRRDKKLGERTLDDEGTLDERTLDERTLDERTLDERTLEDALSKSIDRLVILKLSNIQKQELGLEKLIVDDSGENTLYNMLKDHLKNKNLKGDCLKEYASIRSDLGLKKKDLSDLESAKILFLDEVEVHS